MPCPCSKHPFAHNKIQTPFCLKSLLDLRHCLPQAFFSSSSLLFPPAIWASMLSVPSCADTPMCMEGLSPRTLKWLTYSCRSSLCLNAFSPGEMVLHSVSMTHLTLPHSSCRYLKLLYFKYLKCSFSVSASRMQSLQGRMWSFLYLLGISAPRTVLHTKKALNKYLQHEQMVSS